MPPDPIGLTIVYGPSDEFAPSIGGRFYPLVTSRAAHRHDRSGGAGATAASFMELWLVDRTRPGYGRQIPYSVRPAKNCSPTIGGPSGRPMRLCSKKQHDDGRLAGNRL